MRYIYTFVQSSTFLFKKQKILYKVEMRILFLCLKPPYPAYDGASVVMKVNIQSFIDAGCQVSALVLSTQKHKGSLQDIPLNVKEKAHFYFVEIDTSFGLWGVAKNLLFSTLPFHVERFDKKIIHDKLSQILKENTFDVIQLEGLYLTTYVPTIRALSKATIVYRAHNLEQEIWLRQAETATHFLKKKYLQNLAQRHESYEWACLKGGYYDAITTLSPRDEAVMRQNGVSLPILTASFGVDISHIKIDTSILPEKDTIFFLGAMDWQPNIDAVEWFVAEVWDKIRVKYPQWKFYIAGRNMKSDFLAHKNEKDNIFKVGEVVDAQVFMQEKNIMIVPLLAGGGIRIKLIEGMAMGKAIVASSIALEGNPATDKQEVLIADNAVDFANAVCYLIENPDFAQKLAQNAQIHARHHFDNAKLARDLLAFYENKVSI